jgi:hypothetical protein
MLRILLSTILTVWMVGHADAAWADNGRSSGAQGPKSSSAPAGRWWEDPPVERRSSSSRITLTAVGGGLAGLGALTMLAAGITWLVAAGESFALDDECPNKLCYENSRGGDALERARDAEAASGILVGIGMPLMTSGFIMMLFGAGMADGGAERASVRVAPVVAQDGSGLKLEARF